MSLRTRVPLGSMLALLALGLSGCGGDETSPTPGVTISALALTIAPNPVPAVQSSPASLSFVLRYTATLTESAGLGGTVELITGSVYDDATGALIARNQFDSADLVVFVGSSRVAPMGSLAISQELSYTAPAKRAASLVVTIRFRDDRGNLIEPALLSKTT